jgi:hypothetical protein
MGRFMVTLYDKSQVTSKFILAKKKKKKVTETKLGAIDSYMQNARYLLKSPPMHLRLYKQPLFEVLNDTSQVTRTCQLLQAPFIPCTTHPLSFPLWVEW